MHTIEGRLVSLREIQESDLSTLHLWRNSDSYRKYCSTRRNIVSFEEFKKEIGHDLAKDRFLQCVILNRKSESVGSIFAYGLNRTDGYIFVTTYVDPRYEKKGLGAEAFALFIQHLFRSLDLYKLYTEAYSYNEHSIRCMTEIGLVEEGHFLGHRLIDGTRYDLIRFALFKTQLTEIDTKLKRWLKC